MNDMLKEMIAHSDCEVAYLGEFVSQQLDDYLSRLEALGYSPAQAEAGVCAFAQYLIGEADLGRDLPACDHVEDMVELMAGFCQTGCKNAA
jgi:hypothetical protein